MSLNCRKKDEFSHVTVNIDNFVHGAQKHLRADSRPKYNETFSVSWLLLSELFPVHIRGRAIAMATVFNWGANFIVALTFLNIMSKLKIDY